MSVSQVAFMGIHSFTEECWHSYLLGAHLVPAPVQVAEAQCASGESSWHL